MLPSSCCVEKVWWASAEALPVTVGLDGTKVTDGSYTYTERYAELLMGQLGI